MNPFHYLYLGKWFFETRILGKEKPLQTVLFITNTIYVINKDNYIGKSTRLEIEYAQKLGKEVIYLEK